MGGATGEADYEHYSREESVSGESVGKREDKSIHLLLRCFPPKQHKCNSLPGKVQSIHL